MEETVVHQNKNYSSINYSGKKLRNREFVKCEFSLCDFSKSDLRGNSFEDCTFKHCNFSMAEVDGTGFRNAEMISCKMLGIDFTLCNKFAFSFSFEDCIIDYSTFFGLKLRKTNFKKCNLKDVDFSETDLTGSTFEECDLIGARFSKSILEKVDFRTAINFVIDPEYNKLKKAKFSSINLAGLMGKYNLDIEFN